MCTVKISSNPNLKERFRSKATSMYDCFEHEEINQILPMIEAKGNKYLGVLWDGKN